MTKSNPNLKALIRREQLSAIVGMLRGALGAKTVMLSVIHEDDDSSDELSVDCAAVHEEEDDDTVQSHVASAAKVDRLWAIALGAVRLASTTHGEFVAETVLDTREKEPDSDERDAAGRNPVRNSGGGHQGCGHPDCCRNQ